MDGLMLIIASGLVPALPLIVAHGNRLPMIVSALLVLCVVFLWFERDRPAPPARRRLARPAARNIGRLAPAPRPLS